MAKTQGGRGEQTRRRLPQDFDGIQPSRHAALFVLQYLANIEERISIAELAARTGLHRASLYRTLESLEAEGWVHCSGQPRRYGLTLRFAQLGLRALRFNETRQLLLPFATELSLKVTTPTNISFYESGNVVVTDSFAVVNGIAVAFPEGVRFPATCHGSGKILLAYQPREEIELQLSRPAQRFTEFTKTDPEEIRADLALTRERGYGWSYGEVGSRLCHLGFAVHSRRDGVVGAIGIVLGHKYAEGPPEHTVEIGREIAERASAQFGIRPTILGG